MRQLVRHLDETVEFVGAPGTVADQMARSVRAGAIDVLELQPRPGARVTTRIDVRPRLVLAICLAMGFTTLLDQAILNVAVPALRADLDAEGGEIQWILAVYSLTFGLALVPAVSLTPGGGHVT